MSTQRLLDIKDKIESAKNQKAEVKGKLESVEDQMESKFKVKTESAADKELKSRASELDQMEKDLETGEEELENAYKWDE